MRINEHELRSRDMYGDEFTDVHLWLDEFCLFTVNHRAYRHNLRGLQYIQDKWGVEARHAAEQHIIDDGEYFINEHGEMEFYK